MQDVGRNLIGFYYILKPLGGFSGGPREVQGSPMEVLGGFRASRGFLGGPGEVLGSPGRFLEVIGSPQTMLILIKSKKHHTKSY